MATIFNPGGTLTDTGGIDNFSFRFVCTPLASASSGQVRVTFNAHSSSTSAINHASIGVSNGTAGDITGPFNSTSFNELFFTGSNAGPTGGGGTHISGFQLTGGTTIISDWQDIICGSGAALVVCVEMFSTNSNTKFSNTVSNVTEYQNGSALGSYATAGAVTGGWTTNSNQIFSWSLIETQAGAVASLMGAICL